MRRTFAVLQALWLALLIAEPANLHACDMHAGGHAAHTGPAFAAAAERADATHDEHAHHGHHAESLDEDSVPPTPDDGAGSACQCLGECCAAAVAALAATPAIPVAVPVDAPAPRRSAATRAVPRAPDLQLPFANAPPAALTT
ncbi:MAG: hypothetical protein KF689_03065 [Gemmatimonadaceae bacterium]|nr:hypothetical protein [Gemmatimonadaceae bacterium]MCW5827547.1 hypothetical protein [Gemmatimonadaceae bacterium]